LAEADKFKAIEPSLSKCYKKEEKISVRKQGLAKKLQECSQKQEAFTHLNQGYHMPRLTYENRFDFQKPLADYSKLRVYNDFYDSKEHILRE